MSGAQYSKKQDLLKNINRRGFLLRASLLSSGIFLQGCLRKLHPKSAYKDIKGEIKGPNAKAGHLLRDKSPIAPPSHSHSVETLIIGGGIAGLSAARWLKKNGYKQFELLEVEQEVGGNSRSGKNATSSFPLGAHYITTANLHDKELIEFLHEHKVISHFENNLPFYNPYFLVFDPEERLLINGQWQEGLVPDFGVPENDKKQIRSFLALVEELKKAKGTDGKYAFDVPLDNSSADSEFRQLDKISFQSYLKDKGYTSPYLLWYLEYCCKDDFGQKLQAVSAWAGLHYFAGRKGIAANAEENSVLTWPEGNGWLVERLASSVKEHIRGSSLAYEISETANGKMQVLVLDPETDKVSAVIADKVILTTPQYVTKRLLRQFERPNFHYDSLSYAPWVTATITVNGMGSTKGAGLSWDNVAYNTPSVGYVNANQQHLQTNENKKVLTYYLPLCDYQPQVSRLAAYSRSYEQWLDMIIPELEYMHPNITEMIEQMEVWLWGHGMISPTVDYIWGGNREAGSAPIGNKIFFAHSDLSGISIFEEAFHQGIKAAKQLLES
ncbi:FAD-dependent oxidoreductase [Pedobacter sp. SYSU D00535]|uniref:FAD-dependent oxidoreductase n=1 Tax=Pedobacter sp. SYSU D00535 TaxID=2810308 RepID=UPI001A95A172|nr:FAD-dependent oxidoreductase [Pedobacter sp. SYSU D00535]